FQAVSRIFGPENDSLLHQGENVMNEIGLKSMLDTIMNTSGEDFEIVRSGIIVKGAKSTSKTNRKLVQFYPDTDLRRGDFLIRMVNGDKWRVVEVDPNIVEGHIFYLRAYYETEFDQQQQQAGSTTYTFNNSSNIIAGSQTFASMQIDFKQIEEQIQESGGTDKELLHELIKEIKNTFEEKDSLPKGTLTRFSELLEKHSWLTGSLVQILGSAAIQFLFQN
ncbi:MAG: hypothetical protein AAGU75_16940, partial [Bacillota bacterium]